MLAGFATKVFKPTFVSTLQKRSQSVVAGPSKRPITLADRIILGGGMVLSILVYPAWFIYHLPSYRKGVKE